MSRSCPLKSHPDKPLCEHLKAVADSSQKLFDSSAELCSFGGEIPTHVLSKVSYIIGASHDVGKATKYFQNYLSGDRSFPVALRYHSMLSSLYGYFASTRLVSDTDLQQLLALYTLMAIQSHHGVLEKPTSSVVKIHKWKKETFEAQILGVERISELDLILSDLGLPKFSEFARQTNELIRNAISAGANFGRSKKLGNPLAHYFILNILFSNLIDADRMDAAGLSFRDRRPLNGSAVSDYVKKLHKQKMTSNEAETGVLEVRKKLFEATSEKALNVPLDRHIFSLTAPTGFGKTLTGFNFALKLRERLAKSGQIPRIIYVAPFLSILDQNFKVLLEALGIDGKDSELLLLHHHLVEMKYTSSENVTESFSSLESEMLIEGWNSEVIVTTFIQFFYALMGSTPSQLRRLHNIENSIIILDEVQCIPHDYWPLVRQVINYLVEKLGVYIILMTATQPLIFNKSEVMELITYQKEELWKPRVKFQFNTSNSVSLKEFIDKARDLVNTSRNKSILVLMNTITSSVEVFNNLENGREKYYLSANVLPVEREKRIEKISEGLQKNRPLVLVSTQVVEAGVDLDFDMVIRDMGPIDSIIQTAGRCNRNGKKDPNQSLVHIYLIKTNTGREFGRMIYRNYLIEKSLKTIEESDQTVYDLAQRYYGKVKESASERESDKLLQAMSSLDYEEIRNRFKLIDERPKYSVFVELDENASEVWERYCEIYRSKKTGLERKKVFLSIRPNFYRYVVNVALPTQVILPQQYGFYYVPNSQKERVYDECTGFITTWNKQDDISII